MLPRKAFSFIFEDPKWPKKILIGGILGLIPIVNLIMLGYAMQIAANVAMQRENKLPNWGDDFGEAVVLSWESTRILLKCSVPGLFFLILTSRILNYRPININLTTFEVEQAPINIGLFTTFLIISIVLLALGSFIAMAGLVHYANTNDYPASLDLANNLSFAQINLRQVAMLWLLLIATNILSLLGIAALDIGIIFTIPYAYAIFGYTLGYTIQQNQQANQNLAYSGGN
jgi:hypothetical protein